MRERKGAKKAATEDWHRADIVAELRKAGWSLRKLAIHHGYKCPTTLATALARPWPKGEAIIANAVGVEPSTIWPTRYHMNDSSRERASSREAASRSPLGAECVA